MVTFQLAGLEPHLLEKIITKLDPKSYFRMQQTCRGMDEFIRKSKNISVHLDKCSLVFSKECPIENYHINYGRRCVKDISIFHGARISSITCYNNILVNELCDFLKKHRITCSLFEVFSNFIKEECATLINILKPVSVKLLSIDYSGYEAFFQSKTLKRVEIVIDHHDVGAVVPRLLSTFSNVSITAVDIEGNNCDMLLIILQILCNQHPSNLLKFEFTLISFQDLFIDFAGLEENFRGFGLVINDNEDGSKNISMKLPNGFVFNASFIEGGIYGSYFDPCC